MGVQSPAQKIARLQRCITCMWKKACDFEKKKKKWGRDVRAWTRIHGENNLVVAQHSEKLWDTLPYLRPFFFFFGNPPSDQFLVRVWRYIRGVTKTNVNRKINFDRKNVNGSFWNVPWIVPHAMQRDTNLIGGDVCAIATPFRLMVPGSRSTKTLRRNSPLRLCFFCVCCFGGWGGKKNHESAWTK